MKKTNLIIAVFFIGFLSLQHTAMAQEKDLMKNSSENKQSSCQSMLYTCPMHPEVKSDKPGTCNLCGMNLEKKGSEKSSCNMTEKPTFEQITDGVKTQIWIMTQEEHKKMMEEMKDKKMMCSKDSMMMKKMMNGNYHIKVKTIDAKTGKDITATDVELKIVSPSKKNSNVKLVDGMNHFGNGINLNEKGKYMITVMIKINNKNQKVMFSYEVKSLAYHKN
jgi:Cu(I)/Ag(I) efflux system membrane fusion protein